MKKPNRREILTSAATFAAATLAGCAAARVQAADAPKPPAPAQPASTKAATAPATTSAATTQANSKPNIAVIGCGGMTTFHGGYLPKYTNVVAVCDVDKNRADTYNKNIAGGKAFVSGHYHDILERKDVDLIMVGTPDHWHTKIVADALRSGRDVYAEKPLTLTIDECRFLCEVVRHTNRVLQVGTQQRSENQFRTAIALCQSGRLGRLRHVVCALPATPTGSNFKTQPPPPELDWNTWLGQAPKTDYIPERCHNNFRWWYEYSGGIMTDWGAHHVDIGQACAAPDLPGPMSLEPLDVELPVPYKNGYPTVNNAFNTPPDFNIVCMFANGVQMDIRHSAPHFPADNGILVVGDKGWMFVNRERFEGPVVDNMKDDPLPASVLGLMPEGSPGQPHERHFVNFLDCVKTRKMPNGDVFWHTKMLTTCHLANIACRLKRKIRWDATAQQIVGDEEADAFQSRAQRKGFEIL